MRYALLLTLALAACDEEATTEETGVGGGTSICPDETIALSDGGCFTPGVPADACPEGFVPDAGGCNPVLPAAPCPPGEMAVPGMTECAPLAPCGDAPWGRIATEPGTVFVDARYVGPEMGSMEQPYRSLQTAILVAPRGGQVAIAAGSYAEDVYVDKPLRVHGRCAELVTLLGGTDPTLAALEIVSPGVEIRDVSISGDTFGVAAAGAEAVLERVRVHDTPNMGMGAFDTLGESRITLRDSLFENNGQACVYIAGAQVTIERSELRDPRTVQALALPISMIEGLDTSSHLVIADSFVHGGKGAGVVVSGSTASLSATAVHDTAPLEDSLEDGEALLVQRQPGGPPTAIELHGVSIQRCHEAGLLAIDADVVVELVTVRDVKPEAATRLPGIGIAVQRTAAVASLSQSLVEATSFGVTVAGASATIDGLLVRGTPGASEGDGILALTLETAALAHISRTRVEHWKRAGISSFGADIVLGSSVLECNTIQLDGEVHQSGRFTFEDAGGNVCGCNGETSPCKVVSSNLEPPQSF